MIRRQQKPKASFKFEPEARKIPILEQIALKDAQTLVIDGAWLKERHWNCGIILFHACNQTNGITRHQN